MQELTNDEVRVTIHRKEGCRVEFQIFVFPNLVLTARKKAVKAVSKDITLPGFRRGKAPEELITKKYAADIEKKFHDDLANLAYTSAQKLAQIPLLNNNATISYELVKQTDEGTELFFAFETEPVISSVDTSSLMLQDTPPTPITEEQIDEAVRQMRFFYANWKPVTDRPIQDGDYIIISLETLQGEIPEKVFDHIRFEVSKERMASWMQKLVAGAKAGDVLEGVSEPDETATEEEKAILSAKKVRLTIHKVEEAELPLLDDEFAKKVGSPDIAAMRAFILGLFTKQAEEKRQELLRDQVSDFLIANSHFDLPASLVKTETEDRIRQLMTDPKQKRVWDRMPREEREEKENVIRAESAQAIRLFYLSRHIVNEAKIPISQKEVQQEAIATLRSMSGGQKIDHIPKEVYALALSKVLLLKAQDYIIGQKQQVASPIST